MGADETQCVFAAGEADGDFDGGGLIVGGVDDDAATDFVLLKNRGLAWAARTLSTTKYCVERSMRGIGPLKIFPENLLPPSPSSGNHTTSIRMVGRKQTPEFEVEHQEANIEWKRRFIRPADDVYLVALFSDWRFVQDREHLPQVRGGLPLVSIHHYRKVVCGARFGT